MDGSIWLSAPAIRFTRSRWLINRLRSTKQMRFSRRNFGRVALAGIPFAQIAAAESKVHGVQLGVCTYSFRDLPRPPGASDSVGAVIQAMKDCHATECELFSPQLEPAGPTRAAGMHRDDPAAKEAARKFREDLRQWR